MTQCLLLLWQKSRFSLLIDNAWRSQLGGVYTSFVVGLIELCCDFPGNSLVLFALIYTDYYFVCVMNTLCGPCTSQFILCIVSSLFYFLTLCWFRSTRLSTRFWKFVVGFFCVVDMKCLSLYHFQSHHPIGGCFNYLLPYLAN